MKIQLNCPYCGKKIKRESKSNATVVTRGQLMKQFIFEDYKDHIFLEHQNIFKMEDN